MASDLFKTTSIPIVSLIMIGIICIVFLTKGRTKRSAGKLFTILLTLTIISFITNIALGYFAVNNNLHLMNILSKIYICVLLIWTFFGMYYFSTAFVSEESFQERNKKFGKIIVVAISIVILIHIVLSILLPLTYQSNGNIFVFGGPLYWYLHLWEAVLLFDTMYFFIKNLKNTDVLAKILYAGAMASMIGSYAVFYLLYKFNCEPFIQAMFILFLYLSVESQDANLIKEFNESYKQAKESNDLKSEFIMNMSHQLRTPMNTILGFSDSLLTTEKLAQSELIDDTLNIEIASKRLLELVNSILDISKLESNKEVLNNQDYNLDTLIYDLSSNINSKIDKENLIFSINANENCPNNLYGDDYKLAKVLNIFLSNAVKYTNYGEVSLNVSSKQIDNENHEFVFHIKNTGHAMKTENFERSFEDLIKLNSDTNNDIDADTLKIIVAKGLLNIINGKVEFINEPGQGTQYIITVTQKVTSPGELGNIREKIQTKHAITYQNINLLGKKALIIDDEKINSIILERLLKQYNLEITSTINPRDGIDKATYENYDIIFVNHQMEEMSGEEVIKKLETTGNRIPPVIGLISSSSEFDKNYKYTEQIECPIDFRKLNKIIKKIFEVKE